MQVGRQNGVIIEMSYVALMESALFNNTLFKSDYNLNNAYYMLKNEITALLELCDISFKGTHRLDKLISFLPFRISHVYNSCLLLLSSWYFCEVQLEDLETEELIEQSLNLFEILKLKYDKILENKIFNIR